MSFNGVIKIVGKWCVKHSTKILAGVAIASEAAGFYFMHKEAPIVRDRLNELPEDAKLLDKVKVAAPVYIPAIGMFVLSTGSIIGGCALGEHRVATLSALYSASEAALTKYERHVRDAIGEDKANEVKKKAVEDAMHEETKAQGKPEEFIYNTGHGTDIFKDPWTGRLFYSSRAHVELAIANFTKMLHTDIWASLNELYDCMDLERNNLGGYFGWNSDDISEGKPLDVGYVAGFTQDGRSCTELVFYDPIKTHTGAAPKEYCAW